MDNAPTIVDQVEKAYADLKTERANAQEAFSVMRREEENAIQEHLEEYVEAKNTDIRNANLKLWLSTNEEYQDARKRFYAAEDAAVLAKLEVDRIRTVISAIAAGSAYIDLSQQ